MHVVVQDMSKLYRGVSLAVNFIRQVEKLIADMIGMIS